MTAAAPVKHPWNVGFVWTPPTPPFTTLTAAQAARFDRDGAVLVESVLDPAEIAGVRAEIDQLEAAAADELRREGGERGISAADAITFTTFLVTRSEAVRRLASHPTLLGICRDLIGPDVHLYHDQAVYKKPEIPRRFPWHQDNGYTFIEPQHYLTLWIPLTDATPQNGCPQVLPGLHRGGTYRHEFVEPLGYECLSDPDGAVPIPAKVGDVVVFSSLTPHLTGPNTTDAVRKAYILQYAPRGARRLMGDPDQGPPQRTESCEDPQRQYPVLRAGEPVVRD